MLAEHPLLRVGHTVGVGDGGSSCIGACGQLPFHRGSRCDVPTPHSLLAALTDFQPVGKAVSQQPLWVLVFGACGFIPGRVDGHLFWRSSAA